MQTPAPIGRRIAGYRRRRGLSQAALAGLVGRSESWLSQVERGLRPVDKLSVITELARVLQVEVEALVDAAEPRPAAQRTATDELASLREFLNRRETLHLSDGNNSDGTRELARELIDGHEAYQAARYRSLAATLPDLLRRAELQLGVAQDWRSYTSAYLLAAKLATKVGAADLALIAADRASTGALALNSSTAKRLAAYQVACALLRGGEDNKAEALAVQTAEASSTRRQSRSPAELSATGSLWLISAVIAARRADRHGAWKRLNAAAGIAETLHQDGNFAWTAFGPSNVAIHRVSAAAELGDLGEALRVVDGIDTSGLPPTLVSRRAQVHLDLARAMCQRRQDAEATLQLLEVERIAPDSIAHNASAREVVREMLSRTGRTRTRTLAQLAARAGLTA